MTKIKYIDDGHGCVEGVPDDYDEPINSEPCEYCNGYGDHWVAWHPTPVACGHCHGSGRQY